MTEKTRRLRLAAGVGALTILVAVVIGVALSAPAPGAPGAAESTAEPSAEPTATAPTDGAAGPSSAAPGAETDPATAPAPPSMTATPNDTQETPPEPATEIPPVVGDSPAQDTALPPSDPTPALLTGPAPEPATAQNKVVDGFPTGIPLVDQSTVTTSDVTVENERVRASLTATTPTKGPAVFAEYDSALARYGFAPAEAPALGGSTARSYNRGAESVTVTVTPTPTGGSGYTILALLVASE